MYFLLLKKNNMYPIKILFEKRLKRLLTVAKSVLLTCERRFAYPLMGGFLFDDDLAIHAMMVTAIPDCQEEEICYGFVGNSHARSVKYAIN